MTGASPVTTILRGGQVAAGSNRPVKMFVNSWKSSPARPDIRFVCSSDRACPCHATDFCQEIVEGFCSSIVVTGLAPVMFPCPCHLPLPLSCSLAPVMFPCPCHLPLPLSYHPRPYHATHALIMPPTPLSCPHLTPTMRLATLL